MGGKGFKSLMQVIFFSAVLLFLLDSKTLFPVCQNLFWQVSGSIIIDCQISINDLISVCVRACVCVYRARGHLVQQQRGRQQRICSYKTDPWANSAHTSFTWWEPRSCTRLCARRCLCVHAFHAYMNIFSFYSCVNGAPAQAWYSYLSEVRCTFFCRVMNKSLCVFMFVLFCHSCKKKRYNWPICFIIKYQWICQTG